MGHPPRALLREAPGTTSEGKDRSPRASLLERERLRPPPPNPAGTVGELQHWAVRACKAIWEGD